MSEQKKVSTSLGLVVGILGFIAGIALLFTETWFIGLFGAIASAAVAYKGFKDSKKIQN